MKMIFDKPICETHECCNHDPNYPTNCSILSAVEGCCIARVHHPRRIQRALAWIDKHWLGIALFFALSTLIIFWTLFISGVAVNTAIDELRRDDKQMLQLKKRPASNHSLKLPKIGAH